MSGIVVVQTAFLGDVVLTTPLLATLAAQHGPVDVVTTPAAADAFIADHVERAAALADFEAAVKAKPDFAEAHNNLGNVLYELGRFREAAAAYEAAHEAVYNCLVAARPAITAGTAAMTEPTWMYENFEPAGSAIGYRINRKLDEVQSPFQKIEIFETGK